jgi:Tfp pilus assembly protein PilV
MPMGPTMHLRARDESGFGMLELLMAMVMLNVGILAVVAAFSSGNAALARANRISTAGTLANKQMEVYRGLKYDNILFTTTEWNAAIADSTYTADTVYQQNMSNPQAPKALVTPAASCPANVPTNACDPSYTVTGADHRSYRVDTYLYFDTPSFGNQLKTITIVVRNPDDLTRTFARVSSTFDPSTGA